MTKDLQKKIYEKCKAKYPTIPMKFVEFEKILESYADIDIEKKIIEDIYLSNAVCQKIENSWDCLIKQYEKPIKGTINKYSWKEDFNEDIFQSLMIEIPKKICTYKGRCSLYGWLKKVTINYTISWIKKNVFDKFDDIDEIEKRNYLTDPSRTSESIEILQCKQYLENVLPKAVKNLQYQEQVIVLCKFVDGLTNREIATKILMIQEPSLSKKLKKSLNTIKSNLIMESWKGGKVCNQTFQNCIKLILEHTEYPIEFNNVLPSGVHRHSYFLILFHS